MLFKSYLKSSKKHISFCVNKSQNHTNRFGKASHFVLAIVRKQDLQWRGHNNALFFSVLFFCNLLNRIQV